MKPRLSTKYLKGLFLYINTLHFRNTLRVTKSAALQDISAGNNNTYLGKRDKDFTFADLKPLKIDFAECSAQGKNAESEPDLKQVDEWLARIA